MDREKSSGIESIAGLLLTVGGIPDMFRRTSALGTVSYKGQRALVVAALTDPRSGIPAQFTLEEVVTAIDPVAYDKTFKRGKMVVTIPESVHFHLKEMARLGQIEHIAGEDGGPEVAPTETLRFGPAVLQPTELFTQWALWEPSRVPFVLDADRDRLQSPQASKSTATFASWPEVIAAPDFGRPGDTKLHLGLLPQPFIGDLRRASIYVLSLNPGLEPSDYYGEYAVPEYRNALLANLKQQFHETAPSFIFLDPRYSWHGGFRWWHGKLAQVIKTFADERGVSFASARATLAAELASIELLPYHSSKFRDADGLLSKLKSVTLAKIFVRDFVVPRVKRGEAIVVVLRKVPLWELPQIPGVILYEGKQAQGAHLDPDSAGGSAILAKLRGLRRKL